MHSIVERHRSAFPRVEGRGVVSVLLGGRSCLTSLTWSNQGAEPASTDGLLAIAKTLTELARDEGLAVLFDPLCVAGPAVVSATGPRVELEGGASCVVSTRGTDVELAPVTAIEEVRNASEAAVAEIGKGVTTIFQASTAQVTEMNEVMSAFGAGSGGLGESLGALETEFTTLGASVRESLTYHQQEVRGAVGWATEIITLAQAVDQIAQSARLLTFNARLESARLGEAGKGFVVIANAIRDLAHDVRSSNELVRRLATSLASSLPRLQQGTVDLSDATERQLERLRKKVFALRDSFEAARGTTLEALKRSEGAARQTRDGSHHVLEHLQFQDRTSQLLGHAIDQIKAIESALAIEEGRDAGLRQINSVGEIGRSLGLRDDLMTPGEISIF